MKWLRFLHAGEVAHGTLEGDAVRRHSGDPIATATRPTDELIALADLHWLPPCAPTKIIGLWNNFRAAAAKQGWPAPAEPLYFLKSPSSAAAHRQPIAAPAAEVGRVVYEGELAVVIGRRAHRVGVEAAAGHIFGYSCANDVTAVDLLFKDPSFPQWTRAKSFDGFSALGPVIETDLAVDRAGLRTLVNGRERQAYAFADMFFSPTELVSRLSHDMVLEPGDVILCGTSLGTLPMRPGTTVDVVIEGIGTLTNVYGQEPVQAACR